MTELARKPELPVSPQEEIYDYLIARMSASELRQLRCGLAARGHELIDPRGRHVGTVTALMVDRETGGPRWLTVQLPQCYGYEVTAVPVKTFSYPDRLMFGAARVFTAPSFDASHLAASDERALCRHYHCGPTRGALLPSDEQRATCSRAFWAGGGRIAWIPGPRKALGGER